MRLTRALGLSDDCARLLHYGVLLSAPRSRKEAHPVAGVDLTSAVLAHALKRYPSPTLRAIARRYYDAIAAATKPDNPPT